MGRARGQHVPASDWRSLPRGPYRWTDERIEAEVREFIGDREDWPTQLEFSAAGKRNLYDAMTRHPGGVADWAKCLGYELRPKQAHTAYPLEDALEEARALIAEHGRLPNSKYLHQLGRSRLAWLVESAGGAKAFCAKHGLSK